MKQVVPVLGKNKNSVIYQAECFQRTRTLNKSDLSIEHEGVYNVEQMQTDDSIVA
jgi:hypothetical protein